MPPGRAAWLPRGGARPHWQPARGGRPERRDRVGAWRDLSSLRCGFTQLGGYGIELGQGTKHNRMVANEVFDVGAGGIKAGLPIHVARNVSSANVVSDNEILDLGLVFPAAVGI